MEYSKKNIFKNKLDKRSNTNTFVKNIEGYCIQLSHFKHYKKDNFHFLGSDDEGEFKDMSDKADISRKICYTNKLENNFENIENTISHQSYYLNKYNNALNNNQDITGLNSSKNNSLNNCILRKPLNIPQNVIFLYNSSSKSIQKVQLKDLVKIYSCGPTVYRDIHVGNTRPAIIMDVLIRLLKRFTNVRYVRNLTDIDDKIIKEAKNGDIFELTTRITRGFHLLMEQLNVTSPDIEPKATDHIKEMIDMIKILIKNGYAYEKNNNVFFEVDKFKNYGDISNQKNCLAGARIKTLHDIKKNPNDFALWKPIENFNIEQGFNLSMNDFFKDKSFIYDESNVAKKTLDEENCNLNKSQDKIVNKDKAQDVNEDGSFVKECIGWTSPWGVGRPGWHIECSAMSYKHLGPKIDIHGGGLDLAFPHHENEFAQSKCSHGDCKVDIWMHSGMINFKNEKMSKSIGNVVLAKDAVEKYSGVVVRYFILSTHYRQDLIWSDEGLVSARKSLIKLHKAVTSEVFYNKNKTNTEIADYIDEKVVDVLKNDLNTVEAISRLHELSKKISEGMLFSGSVLKNTMNFLGIWDDEILNKPNYNEKIKSMIEARDIARKNKDFATSDKIRDELSLMGVEINDGRFEK